jgi:hypothetical protein
MARFVEQISRLETVLRQGLDGDERESLPDANKQTAGKFSNDAGRGDAGVVLQAIPQLRKIHGENVSAQRNASEAAHLLG